MGGYARIFEPVNTTSHVMKKKEEEATNNSKERAEINHVKLSLLLILS